MKTEEYYDSINKLRNKLIERYMRNGEDFDRAQASAGYYITSVLVTCLQESSEKRQKETIKYIDYISSAVQSNTEMEERSKTQMG